jgi:hypothetical protein
MKNKERGALFCQSLNDFPCPVILGKKTPSFGLHRFKQGLKFFPTDDEGFILRGDKRRLLYKGRRKSHRFTILGDTAFEYDCILEREPESNVISLRIEGAENFDFYRQPDFVKEPFLKGSYAVYKKNTLVGEGTGKLCHIHRPEIIDARGRRCWGDLAIINNELHITIPENWLAEAKYPVIVDPTVGTTTVGSLTRFWWEDNEDWYDLFLELAIGVNRFQLPETFNGLGTGYVYTYHRDSDGGCKPVLYSDSGNSPVSRRSANEQMIDIEVISGKPAGWRAANFNTNTSLASGSYIWYGVYADWLLIRYDVGSKYYWGCEDVVVGNVPNTFPMWDVNEYYNFRISMYFTYTSAQNYVRTITQGVKLTDTRRLTGNYIRKMIQTAGVNLLLKRFENFYRKCIMTVQNTLNLKSYPTFFRNITESINVTMDFLHSRFLSRKCTENINIDSQTDRIFNVFRRIQEALTTTDNQFYSLLFIRSITENVQITDIFKNWGAFIRGLRENADSIAETTHVAEYKRFAFDNVNLPGTVFRGLLLFVRIISKVVLRDYILRRFLVAKEDFKLKSVICREIKLDSKID